MAFRATQSDAKVEVIRAPRDSKLSTEMDTIDHFNLNSFPFLLPEEYYAVVFSISKVAGSMVQSVGSPIIKWCSYMGEHGTVVGSEVFLTGANTTFIQKNTQQLHPGNCKSKLSNWNLMKKILKNFLKRLEMI